MATARLMLPKKRNDSPEWEVTVDGKVVGWIVTSDHRSIRFYEARAMHPIRQRLYSLNLDTKFESRLEAIESFVRDPSGNHGHEIIPD